MGRGGDPVTRRPRPASPTSEQTLELGIEKLVAGGLGLARDERGVVLIAGALPGEQVRARVQEGRGVRQGRAIDVLTPSPERVPAPDLPTADLAHARYGAQLEYKRGFVQEALERIGKLEGTVAATVPSPREWAYRNTAQYLVTPAGLAYRQRRGHAPTALDGDPLVLRALSDFAGRLEAGLLAPARELALRASLHTGEVVATLIGEGEPRAFLRASDHLLHAGAVGVSLAAPAGRRFSAGVRLIAGEPEVLERYGDVLSSVSASGFAQVNPEAAGELYREAAFLAGRGERAVDLYGGSGAIGRHLARQFAEVLVLDVAEEALARGRRDVARDGVANVRFKRGDAGDLARLENVEATIVDPPRAGLDPAARDALHASPAARLVYVSCDPATWARDVGDLTRRGWELRSVTPYDFYPQTSHVEVLSLLTR